MSTAVGKEIIKSVGAATPCMQHTEGPHWDHGSQVLYWVDTFRATLFRWDSRTDKVTSRKLENRDSIGIVIPVKNRKDQFVAGADRFFYKFSWNGEENDTGKLEEIHMIEKEKPRNQFNDGKADAKGHLWVGTLSRKPDLGVTDNGGCFYRTTITKEWGLRVTEKIQNTSISNGLAWTKDNTILYYIDSRTRKVSSYDCDIDSGNITNKKTVFDLQDHPDLKGIPDGMTIDYEDNLWIALFGGHAIIQVNPVKHELKRVIQLPCTYVTSACFGGPNLDVLFVTTSKLRLDEKGMKEEPLAGKVLSVSGLRTKGFPGHEVVLQD